jgi:DNA topoisomerase-1
MEEYIIREIVSKRKKNYKHKYYDTDKKEIKDKNYIKFITEGIYIAPAYRNVKINIDKKGKVRAIGYDDKDRPQYIYNKEFIDKQKDKKFNHMVEFGKKFNKINKSINEDLYSVGDTKEKQIAMILKLIMECNFRIGNERYSKKNKSYGTTTLEQQHIKIKKKGVVIDFIGKKKVRNICTVKNKKIIKTLKEKKRTLNKNDRIFSYRVGNKYFNIKSSDVNKYLKKFGKFSAKNFRTWGANMELITTLLKISKGCERSTKKEIKDILKKSIKEVANKLHNTESVCKSNYLDPELIKYFTVDCEGFLKNFYLNEKEAYNKDDISKKYIEFLENI